MIVMPSAHDYSRVFRIWPMRADKTPMAAGFSKDRPTATWDPDAFDPTLPVGILCGPLQPGVADDRHVIGLDLDKAFTRVELEDALGPLPPTLSSKGGRHLYYWLPADHGLHQSNGLLQCPGGQLDIRPCAGGYLVEKGDWDGDFDPDRIEWLPELALARLKEAQGERTARVAAAPPIAPAQMNGNDMHVASELAGLWTPGTTGDQAFGALGGWLSRRGVSAERAVGIVCSIAHVTDSTHPDPVGRALQAYDGSCPLGRPALQAALARDADPGLVVETLDALEPLLAESVDGWLPPEAPPSPALPPALPATGFIEWSELMQPLGEVPWLIRDLEVCPGRPPLFISDSGVGKTWLLQTMALAVATGTPFLGSFACRQGPVLHLSRDSGLRATKARYQRLARGMGIRTADVTVFPHALPLTDRYGQFQVRGLDALMKEVERRKYALVILDSLAALCPGIDENSTDIGDPLRATTSDSTVFLWAHHTTKNGEGYRGSGAIKAAAGAVYLGVKEGDARIWRPMKASEEHETGELPAFATRWVVEGDGARVEATDPPQAETKNDWQKHAERDVVAMLRVRGSASHTELRTAAGAPPGTKGPALRQAMDVIGDLARRGVIQNTHGEHFVLAAGI
jgi:hypothetical protein